MIPRRLWCWALIFLGAALAAPAAAKDDYAAISTVTYDFSKSQPEIWFEGEKEFLRDGAYHMKAGNGRWAIEMNHNRRDFIIQTNVQYISGNEKTWYGLMLRKNDRGYYKFMIKPSTGEATLYRILDRKAKKLSSATIAGFDPAVKTSLKVYAVGAVFKCYVNEKHVLTAGDQTHSRGSVGFSTSSGHHVAYDDLTIQEVLSTRGRKPEEVKRLVAVAKGDGGSAKAMFDDFFGPVEEGQLVVRTQMLHQPHAGTLSYRRYYYPAGTRETRSVAPLAVLEVKGKGADLLERAQSARWRLKKEWESISVGEMQDARKRLDEVVQEYKIPRRWTAHTTLDHDEKTGEFSFGHVFYRSDDFKKRAKDYMVGCIYRLKETVKGPGLLVATAMLERKLRLNRGRHLAALVTAYDAAGGIPDATDARKQAEEFAGKGQHRVALRYLSAYLRGNPKKEEDRIAVYKQASELAGKLEAPPPLPQAALHFAELARESALKGREDQALAHYAAASAAAPWWADPHLGTAVVLERLALAGVGAAKSFPDPKLVSKRIKLAAERYRLFAETAPDGDPRIGQAEDKTDKLEDVSADLMEPARVKEGPGWPYGRPAVMVGIAGVGVRWNLYENKSLWTHRAESDKAPDYTKLPTFSMSLAVRILPRLTIGFVGSWWNTMGAKEENLDLDMSASHYMGVVRYDIIQESQWGDFSSLWIEGGGGYLTAKGNFSWDEDGKQELQAEGAAFCTALGIEYHWGDLWALEIFSRLFFSSGIDVHDTDTGEVLRTSGDKAVAVNFTNWEVIGVRIMLSF